MKLGSLCTGYGGLDLAAEAVLGPLQHAWHAEIDPHASKVLAHHWPQTPNLGDLTEVDWTAVEPVDVLTAGFPCQDVSLAGKGAGLIGDRIVPAGEMACGCQWGDHQIDTCEAASPNGLVPARLLAIGLLEEAAIGIAHLNTIDRASDGPPPERLVKGTRTGVWKAIKTAINELRPKIVLLENVRGLLSARADSDVEPCPWCLGDTSDEPVLRALGAVLADLADLGFDAEWTTVAASDVGAPHRRERVFIAAWPSDCPPYAGELSRRVAVGGAPTDGVTLLPTPAAARSGRQKSASPGAAIRPSLDSITKLLPTPRTSDTNGAGSHGSGGPDLRSVVALLPTPTASEGERQSVTYARGNPTLIGALLPTPTVADSRGSRNATAGRSTAKPSTHSDGWTLSDVAYAGKLLPTPMAADGGSDRASSAGFGLRDTSREIPDQWGDYAPAVARWEAITGRQAPSPTEPGKNGQPRLAPPFVEWLMGLPAGWVTDHLGRGPSLKCLGNGVVWQQAAHAYTELLAAA